MADSLRKYKLCSTGAVRKIFTALGKAKPYDHPGGLEECLYGNDGDARVLGDGGGLGGGNAKKNPYPFIYHF